MKTLRGEIFIAAKSLQYSMLHEIISKFPCSVQFKISLSDHVTMKNERYAIEEGMFEPGHTI